MVFKYLSTFLTVILSSISSISTPIRDSYIISMPLHLDLNDSGSFSVELVDNNLDDIDTININFDETFILKDKHGKPDISGTINNPNICFDKQDSSSKTVHYNVDNATVGQWQGNLNVCVSLDRQKQSNVLLDGQSINQILQELNPSIITFSHSNIDGDYLFDLSTAQDESILLYKNGNEVIISNHQDCPILANPDMSNTFSLLNVTAINNLDYLDTSNCTNMSRMFQWTKNITTLDVSGFDTSEVTDMSYMFDNMQTCTSLVGLENFDTTNVTTISHLLSYDSALLTVPNLGSWNITDKCADISYAFNCVGYTPSKTNTSKWLDSITYDYSGWDVSSVNNMSHTFANAFKLKTLDLSGWDTSNVTDMSSMFEMTDSINKSSLTTIYGIENFDVSNVTNMNYLFHECRSLIADLSSWYPQNLQTLIHGFYDTRYLDIRKLENWYEIIESNSVDYTDCFDKYSGYYVERNYKPSWYK